MGRFGHVFLQIFDPFWVMAYPRIEISTSKINSPNNDDTQNLNIQIPRIRSCRSLVLFYQIILPISRSCRSSYFQLLITIEFPPKSTFQYHRRFESLNHLPFRFNPLRSSRNPRARRITFPLNKVSPPSGFQVSLDIGISTIMSSLRDS